MGESLLPFITIVACLILGFCGIVKFKSPKTGNAGRLVGFWIMVASVVCFAIIIILYTYDYYSETETPFSSAFEKAGLRTPKEIEEEYKFKDDEPVVEIPTEYSEEALLAYISGEDGMPYEVQTVDINTDTEKVKDSPLSSFANDSNPEFVTMLNYIVDYMSDKDYYLVAVTQSGQGINNCTVAVDGKSYRFVTGTPSDVEAGKVKIYLYYKGDSN